MRSFLLLIFTIIISQQVHAQKKRTWLRDLFKPNPPVEDVAPTLDTAEVLLVDSSEMNFTHHFHFDLDEEYDSIANETFTEIAQKQLFDTTAQYQLGSNNRGYWISIDTTFAIFDSVRVNPYGYDVLKLKDTLLFTLTDSVRSWSMPLKGTHHKTSTFGPRGYSFHYGTDLRVNIGDSIFACFDGIVRIEKYNKGGYGNYVMLRHHNGLETLYGHMSKRLVEVGQEVKAGDLIGLGGNTGRSSGPHLHFEIRFRGVAFEPEDIYDFAKLELKHSDFELSADQFNYIKIQRQKVYHIIRSGDTLYGIARRYRVKASQICRLNNITTKTTLRIGRKLRIK